MLELNNDEILILQYFHKRLEDKKQYNLKEVWRLTKLTETEFNDSLEKLLVLKLLSYDGYVAKITDKGIELLKSLK